MTVFELTRIMNGERKVKILDINTNNIEGCYSPEEIPAEYDDCEVLMLDIDGSCFEIRVEIPEYTIRAQFTVEVEMTVRAATEDEAIRIADENVEIHTFGDMVEVSTNDECITEFDLTASDLEF